MEIKVYPGALSSEFCHKLIRAYHDIPEKIPSHVYNGSHPDGKRQGTITILKKDEDWVDLRECLLETTRYYIHDFAREHAGLKVMVSDPYALTDPRIEEIPPGGGFDWHMDARQHTSDRRFLTVFYYLNDVREGGETEFHFQGTKIQSREGTLMLFPPYWTHIHKGYPPKACNKYTVAMFATLTE